jgi:glutamyl-tRNA synthetase
MVDGLWLIVDLEGVLMTRVRFAPSPTGFLHIGSARTALFNYLLARKTKGSFILRIEDTDQERSKEVYLKEILKDLQWLGLNWDEGPIQEGNHGPYFQLQRLKLYEKYALQLLAQKDAYYCFCPPEKLAQESEAQRLTGQTPKESCKCKDISAPELARLENSGKSKALRFKVPPGKTLVHDLVRGQVVFENDLIEDFIIIKKEGVPVYNFAAVIDDALMEITHVVRGEEHLSNTPRQIMIYKALGFTPPAFAHIPIILNPDRTKLSKRKGATNLSDFKESGYLPEALFNFLALLGWAPANNRELLTPTELEAEFDLGQVSKHPAVFDLKKLDWINAQYLKKLDPETLAQLALPYFKQANLEVPLETLKALAALFKERLHTLQEFPTQALFFFQEPEYEPPAIEKYWKADYVPEALKQLSRILEDQQDFSAEALEASVRNLAEKLGLSAGKIIHPTRVALTGKETSPGLFEIMALLGKDKVLKRLKRAIEYLAIPPG